MEVSLDTTHPSPKQTEPDVGKGVDEDFYFLSPVHVPCFSHLNQAPSSEHKQFKILMPREKDPFLFQMTYIFWSKFIIVGFWTLIAIISLIFTPVQVVVGH